MKAVRIDEHGGTDVLKLEHVPTPRPQADEVLIEVKAIGINFADILTRAGRYPMAPAPPLVLGNEAAGIIAAVADDVVDWKPGDRVTGLWANSYAQSVVVPADRLISVPKGMGWEDAAAFPLQGITAYHLVHTVGNVQAGDRVLIHAAAGGVGLLLVQLCKQVGATVYGTSSSAQKAAIAKRMGADRTINYQEQDFVKEVKSLTNDLGVNVIFDSVGKATFAQGLESLAPLGQLVTFGTASGPADPVSPPSLFQKSLSISAFSLYSLYYTGGKLDLVRQAVDALLEQLASGSLKLTISQSFSLENVAQAHAYVESRQSYGKVVLSV